MFKALNSRLLTPIRWKTLEREIITGLAEGLVVTVWSTLCPKQKGLNLKLSNSGIRHLKIRRMKCSVGKANFTKRLAGLSNMITITRTSFRKSLMCDCSN